MKKLLFLMLFISSASYSVELPKVIDICKLSYPNMSQELIDWQLLNCN